MSLDVRVEIPSHSYSINVSIAQSASVRDLKLSIFEHCQGRPAVDGQRLITKGRVLQDQESILSIWSEDDIKVVFLAVNPTSWTASPPAQRASTSRSFADPYKRNPPALQLSASPSSQRPQTLSYVQYMHTNALLALQRAPLVRIPSYDIPAAREWSKLIVESYGFEWPKALDEDFPGSLSTIYPHRGGVYYRSQYIDGYPYMSLSPKSTDPTPLQARAIEILTYSFPLLSSTFQPVYYPTWISSGQIFSPNSDPSMPTSTAAGQSATTNVANNAAQQNQRIPPAPARPQLPNFPYRAFAIPFLMLSLRTVFLLYIFSPTKKPVFALLLTAWLIWELWAAAQGVLAEERAARQPGAANAQRDGNGDAANGVARPNVRPQPNGNNQPAGNPNRWAPHQALVDRLAAFRLRDEGIAFDAPEGDPSTRAPSLFSRIRQALILFVLTVHPEVWNRRRRSLRDREARVKREMVERRRRRSDGAETNNEQVQGQTRPQAEPEIQLRRRAPWLEEYIQRIERAEWVDG